MDGCEEAGGHFRRYAYYRNYAERMGEFRRSNADFVTALAGLGFERKRTNKGSVIKGLRIREDEVFEDLTELEEIEE